MQHGVFMSGLRITVVGVFEYPSLGGKVVHCCSVHMRKNRFIYAIHGAQDFWGREKLITIRILQRQRVTGMIAIGQGLGM